MSFLIESWSENIQDPLADLYNVIEKYKQDETSLNHQLSGFTNTNLPPPWSPLLLLWKDFNFYPKVLENLLAYGVDIDQPGENGYNVLYLIILFIFHEPIAIDYLEWWLKMGANPNFKLIKDKKVLLPLEFFFMLEAQESWNSRQFLSKIKSFDKNPLSEDSIQKVVLLFACFQTEKPNEYQHAIFNSIIDLQCKSVNKDMIEKFPFLKAKLEDFYKMPKGLLNFWTRHIYLSRNFHRSRKKKTTSWQESDIVINPYFCVDDDTPKDEYIEYKESDKTFYILGSMVSSILKTGINPCTNLKISLETKMSWVDQLSQGIYFPYKTLEENKEIFPLLFSCPEKSSVLQSASEILHKIISKVHPYTSIMNIRRWKSFEIKFASSIFEETPYLFTNLKNVDNHQEFLIHLVEYIYLDMETNVNKIHFGMEDISEDIKLYHSCKKFFTESGQPFAFSFFDALLYNEIYNLLKDRIGYYSFYDMGHLWYRMCSLYYLEHNLSEDTEIMLIE